MFVQLIRHNSMNQQKVGDTLLSEGEFQQISLCSKWQEVSDIFCLLINITSCPKTTDSKYFSPFQSHFRSYCKTNRRYMILLWDVNSLIIWYTMAKRVSGMVFPTHDANSIIKGSEWCWPLCYRTIWTQFFVLQIVSDIASFVKAVKSSFPIYIGG